jgi:methylated-DNA-[protein]-cysteine S-methyltransferase
MNYTAYMKSPVGNIKITCNNESITSIDFIDSFPGELNSGSHPLLIKCISQLEEYFALKRTVFDLPLQHNGTDFQNKIWQLLMDIPFGTTLSYLQLSKKWGDVKAIRAVAAANGKNKLAIVIPCHRVIGTGGSLTGYAGGLERKKWLLEHEGKQASLF